jgi:Ring finger domain
VVSGIVSTLSAAISLLLVLYEVPPSVDTSSNIAGSCIFQRLINMMMVLSSTHYNRNSHKANSSNSNRNRVQQTTLSIQQKEQIAQCNEIFQNRYLGSSVVRSMKKRISYVCCCMLFYQFFIGIQPTHATLYVNNNTYPTLPALFGRYMVDGKTYEARLQYFHDNPYLCDMDEKTLQKFVPPTGGIQINHFGGSNLTIYEESVALLVVRGNCPFQKKASIAELIHDSIKVLLIANFNLDNVPEEDETLVPMYSQYGDTRLVLLSISHATGQALKKYLSEIPADITKLGGPMIQFDSVPPYGLMTEGDLEAMMFSALGIFFMLISFTGCLVILTGTYHQLLMNQNGGPITAATQRRLLTEEEVQQFTTNLSDQTNGTTGNNNDFEESLPPLSPSSLPVLTPSHAGTNGLIDHAEIRDNVEADQCAICLGEFDIDEDDTIAILPCQHKFHMTCITPWLTERQSKCPLCKFDVLQHIREQSSVASAPLTSESMADPGSPETAIPTSTAAVSFWDQLGRYRWTSIATYNQDDNNESTQLHLDGVMRMVEALSTNDLSIGYDDDNEFDDDNHRRHRTSSFEMTEPRRNVS